MFTRDPRKVLNILKELTLGTDGEIWIKGLKCAIKAIQELQDHYDGNSEGAWREIFSRSGLKKIF